MNVSCGGHHTLAMSTDFEVYSWGNNQYGQLGLSITEMGENFSEMKQIKFFKAGTKMVTWISAGEWHSAAVTIEGFTYLWGRNHLG